MRLGFSQVSVNFDGWDFDESVRVLEYHVIYWLIVAHDLTPEEPCS